MAGASSVLVPDLFVPVEVLHASPSVRAGMAASLELTYKLFAAELVQEMGVLLRLPQVVMATAQTLLHRFYYRKSLTQFDAHKIAMASVFLAAKVEETPRRMRDILNVGYYAKLRRQRKVIRPLPLGGQVYRQWKLELIDNERLILKELGFCMYSVAQHPHKYLLNYVAALQGSAELAQSAWNYCNDSLRLNLCVRYPAQCIATAAIFLASLSLQEPLPSNVAWYEVFSTSKADMEDIAEEILSLYERPKIGWLPSMRTAWSPADDDEVDETFAMSGEAELLVDAASGVDTSRSVTPQPQSALPSHTAVAAPGSSSGVPSSIDAFATARSVAAAIAAARARAAAIVAAAASAAAAPSAPPLASQPTRAPPPTFERASSARAGDEAGVLARNVRQSPRTDRDVADARTSGEEHRWDRNRRGLDNGDPRSANSNPHSHRSRSRSPRAVHSRASRFG